MPSWVTPACDSSEGITVAELRFGPFRQAQWDASAGLPGPSWELGCVSRAKAWATRSLERRAQREAGFTEQRQPPSLDSGRITGRCTPGPHCLAQWDASAGVPGPSWELGCVSRAKAWATRSLERRAQREAGFTEQRQPPSLNSGRITGRCTPGPALPELRWSFALARPGGEEDSTQAMLGFKVLILAVHVVVSLICASHEYPSPATALKLIRGNWFWFCCGKKLGRATNSQYCSVSSALDLGYLKGDLHRRTKVNGRGEAAQNPSGVEIRPRILVEMGILSTLPRPRTRRRQYFNSRPTDEYSDGGSGELSGDSLARMDVWRYSVSLGARGLPVSFGNFRPHYCTIEPAPTSHLPLGRFVNQCSAMSKRLKLSDLAKVVAQKAATSTSKGVVISEGSETTSGKRALYDGSKGKQVAQSPEPKKARTDTGASGAPARPPVASGVGSSAQQTLGEALGPQASVMASAVTAEKILAGVILPADKEKVDRFTFDQVVTKFLHVLGQGVILGSSLAVRSRDFAECALNQKAVAESAEMEMVRVQNRAIELEGALAEEKAKGKKLIEDPDARDKVIAKLEARISELEKSQSLTQGRIIAAFKESDDFLEAVRGSASSYFGDGFDFCKRQLANQYLDLGVDLEDVEMDHELLAKEEAEAEKRAAQEGVAGVERQSQRTRSRSHVDGKLNAEWVESAGKWFNGGNGSFYFSKIGTSRDLGRWARSIIALSCMYINGVNLFIHTFPLLSKYCSVSELHLAVNRSTVPFMFSKTNLGGEESKQSLPSWISDHLGAKSYIDETSQSPSFPPIPPNSPEMDTSSLTKEGNVMSQAELDKLGSTYSFPSGVRLRIPGDGETILSAAKASGSSLRAWPPAILLHEFPDLGERQGRAATNCPRTEAIFGKIEPGGYFEVSKVLGSRTFRRHFAVGCTALSTSGGDNTTSGDEAMSARAGGPALGEKIGGKAKAEKATKVTTAKSPTKGVVIREKLTREGVPVIETGEPDSSKGKEAAPPPLPKKFKSNRGAINARGRAAEAGTSSPSGDVGSESMSDASVARRLLTGQEHLHDIDFHMARADSAELELVKAQKRAVKAENRLAELNEERSKPGAKVDDLKATVADLTNKLAKAKELAIEDFKASKEFKAAVTDSAATYFGDGFEFCERQLLHQYPNLGVDVANMAMDPIFAEEEEAMKGGEHPVAGVAPIV
ncbi:hypothetical protein Acr_20g0008680 [Actinidia rufa]|uniref:Uncharacterized protein n=1 Tax=Actinidia rufa TaxID=165716 RepID=A0A7J0GE11_9ERIC|nr:hypothetical protein Acr_20g0008680 [Actinidia rufa]